jgi:hypothetical protein
MGVRIAQITIGDVTWLQKTGIDDGSRFVHEVMLHNSGRILAAIACPAEPSAYAYKIAFYLTPEMDMEDLYFIDLESAKQEVFRRVSYWLRQHKMLLTRKTKISNRRVRVNA